MIKSELQAEKMTALLAERDQLRAEIERLRKLCGEAAIDGRYAAHLTLGANCDCLRCRLNAACRGE